MSLSYYYEFTAEADSSITIVFEHNRQEILSREGLSLEETLQELEQAGAGIWDYSESFTPAISTPAVATSKV